MGALHARARGGNTIGPSTPNLNPTHPAARTPAGTEPKELSRGW